MAEQMATLPNDIEICYETFGDANDPAVLLVMGLGGPMGWWATELCEMIAARGHFVIRYDNRDTGRSTKFRGQHVSTRDLVRAFLGKKVKTAYRMSDLADDGFGLLDHLGIEKVNLVGVSMGGMVIQTMAIARPERVLSLTSIMSTTGKRSVGWQHPKTIPMMLTSAGNTVDSYIERSLKGGKVIGSPGFPTDDSIARARARETYERGWIASGVSRQMLAILTQPDRTEALRGLDMPTTVIHGTADILVNPSGGRATSAAIRGSELISVSGMGHDLPKQLHQTFTDAITRTAARAAAQR